MTAPVGGLRARFLFDSWRLTVTDILTQLGWLHQDVAGRSNVTLLDRPAKWDEPVPFNSIALSPGNVPDATDAEVGSNLATRTWTFYVEVFAENQPIGMHLINDVRDALLGLMPSIGHTSRFFSIYKLDQATPPLVGRAEVTSVVSDTPPHSNERPWARDLHVLIVEVEDTYGDETDA